eukprot:3200768-Amphidinium_carterae.2
MTERFERSCPVVLKDAQTKACGMAISLMRHSLSQSLSLDSRSVQQRQMWLAVPSERKVHYTIWGEKYSALDSLAMISNR